VKVLLSRIRLECHQGSRLVSHLVNRLDNLADNRLGNQVGSQVVSHLLCQPKHLLQLRLLIQLGDQQ